MTFTLRPLADLRKPGLNMRVIHEKPRSTPQHVNTPGELRSRRL